MKEEESLLIPDEIITNKIYLIRNQKVMLDREMFIKNLKVELDTFEEDI
jgi:hypothetical protein